MQLAEASERKRGLSPRLTDEVEIRSLKEIIVVGRQPPPITGENLCKRKIVESFRTLGFSVCDRGRYEFRSLVVQRHDVWILPGFKTLSVARDLLLIRLWLASRNRVFIYIHNRFWKSILDHKHMLGWLRRPEVVFVVLTRRICQELRDAGFSAVVLANTLTDMKEIPQTLCRKAKRLLWFGVTTREKGFPKAYETFDLLQQLDSEWRFDVYGRGECFERRGDFPLAQFHGFVDSSEKPRIFAEGGVFIFPSEYINETQPMVVMEAMACGMPVVASNIGGIPEMLETNGGICGFTLATESPTASYKDAILQCWQEYDRMSLNSRRIFTEKFNEPQWINTLRQIVG